MKIDTKLKFFCTRIKAVESHENVGGGGGGNIFTSHNSLVFPRFR